VLVETDEERITWITREKFRAGLEPLMSGVLKSKHSRVATSYGRKPNY